MTGTDCHGLKNPRHNTCRKGDKYRGTLFVTCNRPQKLHATLRTVHILQEGPHATQNML